ncbi:hypothetical protein WKI71_43845 [Streptomyces sp. MS1.AVA.1]|uniref:HNH endonuclease n=1 Tax=Streptomyces machairae TaxID=3134109 RepID=A0ABU8UV40_9ACTN
MPVPLKATAGLVTEDAAVTIDHMVPLAEARQSAPTPAPPTSATRSATT